MTEAERRAREIEIELALLDAEDDGDAAPALAAAPEQIAAPTGAQALGRGVVQGGSFGTGDEIGGGIQALLLKAPGFLQKALGGSGFRDEAPLGEIYRQARNENRQEDAAAREAHPVLYGGGELAGGVATSFVPGLGLARGAKLGATLGKTALAGGLAGMGNSTAESGSGVVADTLTGAGLGAGLGAAGVGLGRLGARAGRGVVAIDEAVARKGAEEAAAVTAKARSAAGTTAQDAYKQLEHLRELGAMRSLSAEEAQVASQLERELAEKAQGKLLPAAQRKAEAATAYSEAMASEGSRAAENAAQKLSGGELKQQVLARALRYGLPALGGAIYGGNEGGGMGALAGAGVGALSGAGMRPMMQSLLRLAKQPVVQRPLLQAAGAVMGGAEPAIQRAASVGTPRLNPQMAALIAALRGEDEPDEALAQGVGP